jgi:hypothetical protein
MVSSTIMLVTQQWMESCIVFGWIPIQFISFGWSCKTTLVDDVAGRNRSRKWRRRMNLSSAGDVTFERPDRGRSFVEPVIWKRLQRRWMAKRLQPKVLATAVTFSCQQRHRPMLFRVDVSVREPSEGLILTNRHRQERLRWCRARLRWRLNNEWSHVFVFGWIPIQFISFRWSCKGLSQAK